MPPIKPQLPSTTLLLSASHKPHARLPCPHQTLSQQTRHATLLRRPHRPYTFTQLLTLSDGSTFTHRTTSPLPVYKSNKDTRNTPLWNPSNAKMANVEEDEAGRLRAFRKRFGRGWDAEGAREEGALGLQMPEAEAVTEEVKVGVKASEGLGERVEVRTAREKGEKVPRGQEEVGVGRRRREEDDMLVSASEWSDEEEDNLLDLISSFGKQAEKEGSAKAVVEPVKTGKAGKGRK